MNDYAQVLAGGIQDPDASGPAAIYVSFQVNLHAIRVSRPLPLQITEKAVGCQSKRPVGLHFEGPYVPSAAVVYVEDIFDVSEIAKKSGGGGHRNSAGFVETLETTSVTQ